MVDELRPQRYEDPREGLDLAKFHERTRRGDPGAAQRVVRVLTWPLVHLVWRVSYEGSVPMDGPVLVASNHASFMDHFFIGHGIPRPCVFMAKSQLFNAVSKELMSVAGAFPVRRGAHDEDAIVTAEMVLERGSLVIMYPQGGRARGQELGGKVRAGVGRLALETGAPVVPTAVVGSAHVREWRRGHLPQVHVRFGEPIGFGLEQAAPRERHQEVAETIMDHIRALHSRG